MPGRDLTASFMLPGHVDDSAATQAAAVSDTQAAPETAFNSERPTAGGYKVQPVVWLWVTLLLAILGLWFFLDGGAA